MRPHLLLFANALISSLRYIESYPSDSASATEYECIEF
jgi:hypothetical protein